MHDQAVEKRTTSPGLGSIGDTVTEDTDLLSTEDIGYYD